MVIILVWLSASLACPLLSLVSVSLQCLTYELPRSWRCFRQHDKIFASHLVDASFLSVASFRRSKMGMYLGTYV